MVNPAGALPGLTGGDLFFHPRFDPIRDGLVLRAEIARVLQRETAYSVTMRIRCSNGKAHVYSRILALPVEPDACPRTGLRIADHYGNFFQRNITDLEFGTIDADKAIAARIKHEGKLDEKVDAYFQCAALYTSAHGERRVRVHNLAVPVSSLISSVFRAADMDTTIAFVAKDGKPALGGPDSGCTAESPSPPFSGYVGGIEDPAASARTAHRRLREIASRLPKALRLVDLACTAYPARIVQALPALCPHSHQDKGPEGCAIRA